MKDNQIRIKISTELKDQFKKLCEESDKDMSKVIIRFIKNFIEKENKTND